MEIGFVFTNYNNAVQTRKAVESILLNENGKQSFIVIVDNKSEKIDIELLNQIKHDFNTIHLILNNENIGYFRGLNKGIEHIRNCKHIKYIVVGNNDLVFSNNFIQSIYKNKKKFEINAIISPDIITADGVHQNPHVIKNISKVRELLYDLYYTNYLIAMMISFIAKITKGFTDRHDEEQYEIGQSIYQGYGACYILGPVFFRYFDLLWAPTFLMGEELFLSKQLESKGLKLYYEPTIVVYHSDHATVGKLPNKKMWQISRDSHKVYREYVKIL